MKICSHCLKEIPDDAKFCIYCGNKIENTNVETKNEKTIEEYSNPYTKLAFRLLLIGFIGCDFLLAILCNIIGINVKYPFYISALIYVLSIICSVLSLYDNSEKKLMLNKYSIICLVAGLVIFFTNLTEVIL